MSTPRTSETVVAVLAGGLGTRIGGDKASVLLGHRPLIEHALDCARAAGLPSIVVAKADTRLPPLSVPVLIEPELPRHPLCGVVAALREHPAVVALPCDMPFVAPALLSSLAAGDGEACAGVVEGRLQPFPALYRASTLVALEAGLIAEASVRSTLEALGPTRLEVGAFGDPERLCFTVNSRSDLARASAILTGTPPRGR